MRLARRANIRDISERIANSILDFALSLLYPRRSGAREFHKGHWFIDVRRVSLNVGF